MQRISLEDMADSRLANYRDLKDATLATRRGRFIVEGPGNLDVLLSDSRFQPESILLSEKAWDKSRDRIASLRPDCPVYVVSSALLDDVVGFPIHRGYLAVCRRPEVSEHDFESLAKDALARDASARIVVTESIGNHDNMGGLFRNARAFGVAGVLLCPRSCDPLYRKSIRTSMGGALCVPFARAESWPSPLETLSRLGFALIALDPGGAMDLDTAATEVKGPVALLLGTEGPGLSDAARSRADFCVRIGMAPGVDSINVSVSAAIALHALRSPTLNENIAG